MTSEQAFPKQGRILDLFCLGLHLRLLPYIRVSNDGVRWRCLHVAWCWMVGWKWDTMVLGGWLQGQICLFGFFGGAGSKSHFIKNLIKFTDQLTLLLFMEFVQICYVNLIVGLVSMDVAYGIWLTTTLQYVKLEDS